MVILQPRAMPAVFGATAVVVAGVFVLLAHDTDHHARHMIVHIAAMNVVAPLIAVACRQRFAKPLPVVWLWTASVLQIGLLWVWHAPEVYSRIAHDGAAALVAHALLFAIAVVFWLTVMNVPERQRWQAVPALLLTGKLSCLLAAVLIFAPRSLYGHDAHAGVHLADQQLAGLLMITACPLSYLVAATVIAFQIVGISKAAAHERDLRPASGGR